MKKIIIMLALLSVCEICWAEDDCGLSTININSEGSIISVQNCIKNHLNDLNQLLDNHRQLLGKFRNKAMAIIQEEGLCQKFETYYKNAQNDYQRNLFKANTYDCYALATERTKRMAGYETTFGAMDTESRDIKQLVKALENKYNLLTNQLQYLKDQ